MKIQGNFQFLLIVETKEKLFVKQMKRLKSKNYTKKEPNKKN